MTFAPSRLAALQSRLAVYDDLEQTLTSKGLLVRSVHNNGCCRDSSRRSDTITCREREDDGGTPWFFTSWGKPIAEAVRVVDASVAIYGYLIGND